MADGFEPGSSRSSGIRWFPSILQVLTIIRPETVGALAQSRLSLLLALEVAPTNRPG
jgi:hypothetical protein